MSSPEFPKCAHCGDVIGVYEPLIVRATGEVSEVRATSWAAEPELPLAHAEHYHRACYAALKGDADRPVG